jgi:UDP:flavonoid glycosyltransferase YjiC (YdhE family)
VRSNSAPEENNADALLTIGSRSDLQPFVVLGAALRVHGHDVVFSTDAESKGRVDQAGLGFRSLGTVTAGFLATVLINLKVRAALRAGPAGRAVMLGGLVADQRDHGVAHAWHAQAAVGRRRQPPHPSGHQHLRMADVPAEHNGEPPRNWRNPTSDRRFGMTA